MAKIQIKINWVVVAEFDSEDPQFRIPERDDLTFRIIEDEEQIVFARTDGDKSIKETHKDKSSSKLGKQLALALS